MKLFKSKQNDIKEIYEIIKSGVKHQKKNDIEQWSFDSPWLKTIENDINNSNSYNLKDSKTDKIIAIFTLIKGIDPTYINIYEGKWKYDDEYIAVHRVAISDEFRGNGLAKIVFKEIEEVCRDKKVSIIRIDTHKDNIMMRKAIEGANFEYAGIITAANGTDRVAYEKKINLI